MDADKASVVERLQAYLRRFDELLAMLSAGRPLEGEPKAVARALLTSLKGDLNAEHKRMSTNRGEAALTPAERDYYATVIHQCSAEIHVSTNSTPDMKWHSDLYGARINLTHALGQLGVNAD